MPYVIPECLYISKYFLFLFLSLAYRTQNFRISYESAVTLFPTISIKWKLYIYMYMYVCSIYRTRKDLKIDATVCIYKRLNARVCVMRRVKNKVAKKAVDARVIQPD